MIRAPGQRSRSWRVAAAPSRRGMRRSMSTTSGWVAAASATASSPSAAVPTTSTSGSRLEQHGQPFADHPLVIGGQHPDAHAGTRNSTRKPWLVGPATRVPPRSSARSRMPVRP